MAERAATSEHARPSLRLCFAVGAFRSTHGRRPRAPSARQHVAQMSARVVGFILEARRPQFSHVGRVPRRLLRPQQLPSIVKVALIGLDFIEALLQL